MSFFFFFAKEYKTLISSSFSFFLLRASNNNVIGCYFFYCFLYVSVIRHFDAINTTVVFAYTDKKARPLQGITARRRRVLCYMWKQSPDDKIDIIGLI